MRRNSIVFKMASRLTIILAILFLILVTSNVYSLYVVLTNYYTSSQNTLNLYRVNIENFLDNVSRDLLETFENHSEAAYNFEQLDETGRFFKSLELKNTLMTKMNHESSSDAMFIQNSTSDFHVYYFSNRIDTVSKLDLSDTLRSTEFNSVPLNNYGQWQYLVIGESRYIYKTITYNNITFGTLVHANTLFSILNVSHNDKINYYIEHEDKTVLSTFSSGPTDINYAEVREESKPKNYLVTDEGLSHLGKLVAIVEKKHIFYGLKSIQWFIVALAIIALIVVPLVIHSLSSAIIKPIIELSKAAKDVEKGSATFSNPSQSYSMEFLKLFHSFQSMVNEIKSLKIQAYEEELEKKRLQLDYLQLQIKPHFYLNAISTISSLTYQNKNEEIRNFIQYLSSYLRYMFNRALNLVTIKEEMKQVSNFIKLQEIRYPNQIFFMTEIEAGLEQIKIPNFLLQTFVENAFKHAMFYEEILSLFIRVTKATKEGQTYLYITIEDNGEGFTEHYLSSLDNLQYSNQDQINHIGILNIKRTLELLYKEDGLLNLSNQEQSGARVEIWIPLIEK